MTIEEILKNAGIEDAAVIEAVKAEMPKSFLPLADHNKRIAAAKAETESAKKALEDYKAETEAAQAANEGKQDESAKALADLQGKYEQLQKEFADSQSKHKQRKAADALTKALKDAGANDAALSLLTDAGVSKVEFGDDGEPSNISDVAEKIKADNGGLFGEPFASGKPQAKATDENDLADAFGEGFGETKRN